jgi:hypothetical protein
VRTVLHHLVQGTAGNIIADLRNDIVQQSGGGYDALLNLIKAVDSTKSFERGGTQLLSDYLITMIDLILINQEFLVSQQPAHLGNVTLCVNYFIKYGSAGQDDCSGATASENIKDDIGTLRTTSFQDCTQNTAGVGLQLTGDESPCPLVCQPGTEWMARFFTVGIAAFACRSLQRAVKYSIGRNVALCFVGIIRRPTVLLPLPLPFIAMQCTPFVFACCSQRVQHWAYVC